MFIGRRHFVLYITLYILSHVKKQNDDVVFLVSLLFPPGLYHSVLLIYMDRLEKIASRHVLFYGSVLQPMIIIASCFQNAKALNLE